MTDTQPSNLHVWGLAWDGTHIWAFSNNEQTLYSYVPGSGVLASTTPLPDAQAYQAALEYANGYLYLTSGSVVYKCLASPFKVVTTYRYPNFNISGIGCDGTDFFLLASPATSEVEGTSVLQVVKVALP